MKTQEMVKFDDIFEDDTKNAIKIKKEDYLLSGKNIVIDQNSNDSCGYTNIDENVYTKVPTIIFGDHTRVVRYVDKPFFLGADGAKIIKPKNNDNNIKYLYYYLKSKKIENLGYSRHYKLLKECIFLICTKSEQDKIVYILDTLNKIIELYKMQLKRFDDLVKSRFVEMFGNIAADEKGWGIRKLSECCEINPKRKKDIADDVKVTFLPMPAISEFGKIDKRDIRSYSEVKKGFTYFEERDVLFAKITPCMENGKGAVAEGLSNGLGAGTTELHVMRPIKNITNPYWLYELTMFESFREGAKMVMTGTGGQLRVPVSFLENFNVSLPPIELQEQFEKFYKQVDKSKFVAIILYVC